MQPISSTPTESKISSKNLSKSDFLKIAQKWSFLNVARATFLQLWSKNGLFCAL